MAPVSTDLRTSLMLLSCQSWGSAVSHGAPLSKPTGCVKVSDVLCDGVSKLLIKSSLDPTRRLSVGIGECLIGWKTSAAALRFVSLSVESLEREAMGAVETVESSDLEEPARQLPENWFLEFNFLAFVGQGVALSFCSLDHRSQVTIARVWEMTLSSAKENVF